MAPSERCHYQPHPEYGSPCPPVVAYLAQLRAGGFSWVRPVCDNHARAGATVGEVLVAKPEDLRWFATCGAWVVVAAGPGEAREQRLCLRSEGPCPYPNAPSGTLGDGRMCAEAVERHGTVDLANLEVTAPTAEQTPEPAPGKRTSRPARRATASQ